MNGWGLALFVLIPYFSLLSFIVLKIFNMNHDDEHYLGRIINTSFKAAIISFLLWISPYIISSIYNGNWRVDSVLASLMFYFFISFTAFSMPAVSVIFTFKLLRNRGLFFEWFVSMIILIVMMVFFGLVNTHLGYTPN